MPGCKNRFSFCPRAGSWTAAARKGLDIKRSEFDFLFIQSRVALQDFFCARSLAQHVGNEFDWNARPTIHGRTAHNLRVGNNHVLCTLKSLLVLVEFQPH